jgi:hypothetical protein
MSDTHYRVTIAGNIGPIFKSVFTDLVAEEIPRHHVFLVLAEDPDLLPLLNRLEQCGIEVDRVTAWYS